MKNSYRSFLFVPATDKLLKKIKDSTADAIIIDLEDAIFEADKDLALKRAFGYLKENAEHIRNKMIFVRINPERFEEEIRILNKTIVCGYMLPKTETKKQIRKIKKSAKDKKIIALIESARGILNAEEVVKYKGTSMVAFGAEDYTTKCDISNTHENLIYPKSKIVTIAKAYKKPAIDTISLNIGDKALYREEAEKSKNLGFDAKLAIHPMQVEVINEVFSLLDAADMKNIVEAYENSDRAVTTINGKVFEKPHIDAMKRKIEEYENEEN